MGAVASAAIPVDGRRHHDRWKRLVGSGAKHMRQRDDITAAVEAYADTVLRACAIYLHERADCEDAFQETFLRYARYGGRFNDEGHRKAWLICVASNVCKDMLKSSASQVSSLDDGYGERVFAPGDDGQEGQRALEAEELLALMGTLGEKYRRVLYLKYYEGYTAAEIARMLKIPENTVYTDLARGRKKLKEALEHAQA